MIERDLQMPVLLRVENLLDAQIARQLVIGEGRSRDAEYEGGGESKRFHLLVLSSRSVSFVCVAEAACRRLR